MEALKKKQSKVILRMLPRNCEEYRLYQEFKPIMELTIQKTFLLDLLKLKPNFSFLALDSIHSKRLSYLVS
jgi:hypothetical protein